MARDVESEPANKKVEICSSRPVSDSRLDGSFERFDLTAENDS
jgi:hypothetical protein